ncbi:MAG: alkaline phosphatase, partial [Saprospiraceae bacterium]|nr:alkaline phosphatase [Saprospiraceae bacterium]
SSMNDLVSAFTTDYHTGSLVPVFAYGPGSELFAGIYENTDIYYKMKAALGLDQKLDQ